MCYNTVTAQRAAAVSLPTCMSRNSAHSGSQTASMKLAILQEQLRVVVHAAVPGQLYGLSAELVTAETCLL